MAATISVGDLGIGKHDDAGDVSPLPLLLVAAAKAGVFFEERGVVDFLFLDFSRAAAGDELGEGGDRALDTWLPVCGFGEVWGLRIFMPQSRRKKGGEREEKRLRDCIQFSRRGRTCLVLKNYVQFFKRSTM